MSKIDWAELFGEEEGEGEGEGEGQSEEIAFNPSTFEQVIPVNGLFFSPNQLSQPQQTSLIEILHNNNINLSSQRNQSVLFGLPEDLVRFVHAHIQLPDFFFASRKTGSKVSEREEMGFCFVLFLSVLR